jgi:hypothetical protein
MATNAQRVGTSWLFKGTILHCCRRRISFRSSGLYGYAVRVLLRHPDLANPFEPGLVVWG